MHLNSDDKISAKIGRTLKRRLKGSAYARDGVYARSLRRLPPGLRAIAALYHLDLSLALDSIDWHFLNFSGHARETLEALQFLGLDEMAAIFSRTHELLKPHLRSLTGDNIETVCKKHGLTREIRSLCSKSWRVNKRAEPSAIMRACLDYAAMHPEIFRAERRSHKGKRGVAKTRKSR